MILMYASMVRAGTPTICGSLRKRFTRQNYQADGLSTWMQTVARTTTTRVNRIRPMSIQSIPTTRRCMNSIERRIVVRVLDCVCIDGWIEGADPCWLLCWVHRLVPLNV